MCEPLIRLLQSLDIRLGREAKQTRIFSTKLGCTFIADPISNLSGIYRLR